MNSNSYFSIKHNMLFFSGGTNILQPQVVEAFLASNNELSLLDNYIIEMRERGEIFYKERYDVGFQDGKEEGSFEHLLKIFGTIFSSITFIRTIEERLTHVIIQAVKKIVGDVGALEHIHNWVKNSLITIKNIHQIVLRVAPEKEQMFLEVLNKLKEKSSESLSFITVISDSSISFNKCILESKLGVVASNLDIQVKVLEQILSIQK